MLLEMKIEAPKQYLTPLKGVEGEQMLAAKVSTLSVSSIRSPQRYDQSNRSVSPLISH